MWAMLDEATARMHGASNTEDVIRTVCQGCSKGNLDFSKHEFCPIQTEYGVEGIHESIQYETISSGYGVLVLQCTEYQEPEPEIPSIAEGQMPLW